MFLSSGLYFAFLSVVSVLDWWKWSETTFCAVFHLGLQQ